ncbi:lipase 3-like [Planococcus citri]|uniref:lipase 3-like n=1 Tax=Planococcus citri TaxID=170843 RepID=UPI0031F865B6
MIRAANKNVKKSICIIITTVLIFEDEIFLPVGALQTHTKLKEMGYEVEIHLVDTEDGYTLALERIPHPKSNKTVGDPVLLLHGLFSNSLVFALNYTSLAYGLADAGYDVWLYNSRGNGLSREMTNGNLDEISWKYSFHELGVYDTAACVNYITNLRKKKVNVVGYSLGGTIALILLAERTEFNKKVQKLILMAPAARMKNSKRPLDSVRFWAPFIMEFLDVFDFFPYTLNPDSTLKSVRKYCEGSKRTMNNCKLFLNFINGVETKINDEAVLTFWGSFPQPVSSRTLKHYVQGIISGEFRKYDYGFKMNMVKYNSTVPPQYNISKITTPVVILCSATDPVVTMKDTKWLASHLGNVAEVNSIKNVQFGHVSYVVDTNSKELVVDYIVEKLKHKK